MPPSSPSHPFMLGGLHFSFLIPSFWLGGLPSPSWLRSHLPPLLVDGCQSPFLGCGLPLLAPPLLVGDSLVVQGVSPPLLVGGGGLALVSWMVPLLLFGWAASHSFLVAVSLPLLAPPPRWLGVLLVVQGVSLTLLVCLGSCGLAGLPSAFWLGGLLPLTSWLGDLSSLLGCLPLPLLVGEPLNSPPPNLPLSLSPLGWAVFPFLLACGLPSLPFWLEGLHSPSCLRSPSSLLVSLLG